MISVDGDTSTNDCVFLLANGLAGGESINSRNGEAFQEALNEVCIHLAKSMVRDGEGATKLIEVGVEGAVSQEEARCAARAVASSLLVKAAVHGSDPNWGRVVAALGRSGAQVKESKLGIYLNDVCLMKEGNAIPFNAEKLKLSLKNSDCVVINTELGLGNSGAIAWGCDLSEEYATINSAYTT
jgi:glutamate N-acetyltransferase/amino-acid N-acetyltransferase